MRCIKTQVTVKLLNQKEAKHVAALSNLLAFPNPTLFLEHGRLDRHEAIPVYRTSEKSTPELTDLLPPGHLGVHSPSTRVYLTAAAAYEVQCSRSLLVLGLGSSYSFSCIAGQRKRKKIASKRMINLLLRQTLLHYCRSSAIDPRTRRFHPWHRLE